MKNWLDRIPLIIVLAIAIPLAVAPVLPEPHLWLDLRMLFNGSLILPSDMIDLALHGAPLVLIILRLWPRRRPAVKTRHD